MHEISIDNLFSLLLTAFLVFVAINGRDSSEISEHSETSENSHVEVLMIFTKAGNNVPLQDKFKLCVSSMLLHSSLPVNLHIVGDKDSRDIAQSIVGNLPKEHAFKANVTLHDMEPIARGVTDLLSDLIQYFRYSPNAYYGDNLFFVSIVLHQLAQFHSIPRIIMLDSDLKFRADIDQLRSYFNRFSSGQIIGIARENQPVYRHVFSAYRSRNPGTKIGDPPPKGTTGFNSGVLLLDLEKMRNTKKYRSLINRDLLEELVHKYQFKGHLGDQDFYTLLSTDFPELFYVLPCVWNKQLCVWWKKLYEEVFDQYYQCKGDIKIYHGNCNTPIPEDD